MVGFLLRTGHFAGLGNEVLTNYTRPHYIQYTTLGVIVMWFSAEVALAIQRLYILIVKTVESGEISKLIIRR